MKRIQLLIVFLVFLPLMAMAQQNSSDLQKTGDSQKADDLQKVKDALVISVMHCQDLERQNANFQALIKRVAEDLKKVETIEQLDSLKVVYGIEEKKKPIKK